MSVINTIAGLRRLRAVMDKQGISKKIPKATRLITSAVEDLNILNPAGKIFRFLALRGGDNYSTYFNGITDISLTNADDGQFTINLHQGNKTYSYIANLSVSPTTRMRWLCIKQG